VARPLDPAQRRRDIAHVAIKILADRGPEALTIKAIADELGGSITLVTHIYPTRKHLLAGLAESFFEQYDAELPEREADAVPIERLRILLEWMLPLSENGWVQERARVVLISDAESASVLASQMDQKMRGLIEDHISPLVHSSEVQPLVNLLRILVNGIVLSCVEHRADWPPERQVSVLHDALGRLGLLQLASTT
jgi:AcrR family transcriptional regulator